MAFVVSSTWTADALCEINHSSQKRCEYWRKQFPVPLFTIGDTAIARKKGCTIESINNAIKACQQSSYGGNAFFVAATPPQKTRFLVQMADTRRGS